jgi:hypothetical protein
MSTYIIAILFMLQIKHWYVDFVNQTDEEVKYKAEYLDWRGITHSLKHGFGTVFVFLLFMDTEYALMFGALDFLLHYHIDWAKMNWGNRDIGSKEFWNHLGLDQMAHQFTYLLFMIILLGL